MGTVTVAARILRWEGADRSVVVSPSAFLATTTTRLAINTTQTARRRREIAAGACLPELVDRSVAPETAAERHEAVDVALRLLLEKLTAAERADLLRKAFDYPYHRISEILHLGVANARQLVRRAHERLVDERHQPVNPAAHRRLLETFLAAAQAGNPSNWRTFSLLTSPPTLAARECGPPRVAIACALTGQVVDGFPRRR